MTLPSYAMNQDSFPEMYERWLVNPLFRPWVEMIFNEVNLSDANRVLDVACGTGIVARLARERLGTGGHIVGVDSSADMLTVARALAPEIDWRQGDAADLPLQNGERFDVVVCQQGLQFVPNKAAAMAQMRGALAKDGKLAVATWRFDEEIPFFRDLRRVAESHLGPISDQRYSFGDAAELTALLSNAALRDVQFKTLSRIIRFEDGTHFVRLNAMAFVGMSARGRDMTKEEREHALESIVKDSAPVLQRYSDGSVLTFDLSTNLATARR